MHTLLYSFRFFLRNKYTFILNFIGISIGLSVTILIIGIVYQEYHYDNRVPNSQNIYRLIHKIENGWDYSTTKPLAPELVVSLPEVQNAFRFYPWYGYLACNAEENKFTEKNVIFTDSTFIHMLELPMEYGDKKSAKLDGNSVLLSRKGAMKYFGDGNPIGKQLLIGNNRLFKVTGVFSDFPKTSNFKGDVILDISIIHNLTQVYFPDDWNHNSEFSTFISIHENTEISELESKIQTLYSQNSSEKIDKFNLQKLSDIHIDKAIIWESVPQINVNYLYLLMSVAGIIFFMSLANFNILYISTSLRRETGVLVKMVFGATKWKLLLEYIKEIWGVLTLALFLSCFLVILYNEILSESSQYLYKLHFSDEYFLLIGVMVVVLLLFSLMPAFWLTSKKRISINAKNQFKKHSASGFTNYLITFQFALCALLVFSTLVIQRQSNFLSSFDIGYERNELITIPLNMHLGEGIYNERLDVFCDEIGKYAGIKNITLAFSSPALVQTSQDEADWEGKPDHIKVSFCWNAVYYDYFETIGIEVIGGRSFNREYAHDFDYDRSFANYILNEKAIEEMGIEDPVGKSFSQYGFIGQIVGVVEDFHFSSLHEEIRPMAFSMNSGYFNEIIIRLDASDKQAIEHIKQTWNKFVPDNSLDIDYVSSQLEANYESESNLSNLLIVFTTITMIIAILGLITLTISSTQERVKEIGIRKVNGASIIQLLLMFNREYIRWIVISFVVISPVSWYVMTRWLGNFAYKTNLNIWIFVLAGIIIFLLAIVTICLQCYRVASRNPVNALRHN